MQDNQRWRQGLYDALLQSLTSAVDSLNLSYHPARRQHQVCEAGSCLCAAIVGCFTTLLSVCV
jgi:hypothetical protein